ncbi:MAG: hypothetical protein ABMA02_06090 [Saprospiraceae bacterium]
MKDTTDIRSLLNRYWEGETTLEEERRLKAFFSNENIPEDLQRDAALFRALRAEQASRMPDKIRVVRPGWRFWRYRAAAAAVVLLLVAGFWIGQKQPDPVITQNKPVEKTALTTPGMQQVAKPIEPTTQAQPTSASPKRKRITPRADSVVLAKEDTCEDPEEALAEIRAALALVSTKMNKSTKTLEKGFQEVEHVDILIKRFGG